MKSVTCLTGAVLLVVPAVSASAFAQELESQPSPSDILPSDILPSDILPSDILDAETQSGSSPESPYNEPIISDSEFEEALPDLDAEFDGPVQSIEEFEAEQDEREAQAKAGRKTDADVAALPALQDGDATEEIADAPVTDSELEEPLPALSEFKVEPVEIAEEANDTAPVEIKYSYRLEGLGDLKSGGDIQAKFGDLSALEEGDGDAANATMVAARATEDADLIVRLLTSEGYYDSAADFTIEQQPGGGGGPPLTAILNVTAGKQYSFADIMFKAPPTTPPELIDEAFPLKSGDPIIAAEVLGAEANIALVLPQEGYPFVEIGDRDILLDGETLTGDYTLPVETGPRSSFGGYTTSGNLAFDAEHIGVLARFERGELYDVRKVDDLRQALVATNLFSTVSVKPVQTGEEGPDGTEYVTLDVVQEAGPPRSIAGSAGYGTGQGFRVEGAWTHRNIFPPEGSLSFNGVLGTQEQGVGATFRRYNAGRRDRTVSLRAFANHSDFDAYEAFTGTLAGRISYDSTPIWQKRFTYAYGFELTGTNEQQYNFDTMQRERDTFFIAALPVEAGFDTSDSLLNPTSGYRARLRASPEGSLQGGFSPYVRAIAEASAYYPFGESFVLAGRVKVGTISGASRTNVAPSRRFYGGGAGSVRGFGYQELGPRDPDNDPIGGRSINEAALELRYRFGDFGIVPFVDVGQVYTSSTPNFSNLRFGAGIGGRFYTNFGPLRVDVATPIARKEGESLISVYISIGQAF